MRLADGVCAGDFADEQAPILRVGGKIEPDWELVAVAEFVEQRVVAALTPQVHWLAAAM